MRVCRYRRMRVKASANRMGAPIRNGPERGLHPEPSRGVEQPQISPKAASEHQIKDLILRRPHGPFETYLMLVFDPDRLQITYGVP